VSNETNTRNTYDVTTKQKMSIVTDGQTDSAQPIEGSELPEGINSNQTSLLAPSKLADAGAKGNKNGSACAAKKYAAAESDTSS